MGGFGADACDSWARGCGGSDDSKSGSATTSGVTSESSEAMREEIVIKAQANLQGVEDVGDVLPGSSLGDSPFCSAL
jgi:hypothetical protein